MSSSAPGTQRDEFHELVRRELVAEYEGRLQSAGQQACEQIDRLLFSALRQLPPEIRAMPIREAFQLACGDGGSAGEAGRPATSSSSKGVRKKEPKRNAGTQTALYQVKTKKLKPPGAAAVAAAKEKMLLLGEISSPTAGVCSNLAEMKLAGTPSRNNTADAGEAPELARKIQEMEAHISQADAFAQVVNQAFPKVEALHSEGLDEKRRTVVSDVTAQAAQILQLGGQLGGKGVPDGVALSPAASSATGISSSRGFLGGLFGGGKAAVV